MERKTVEVVVDGVTYSAGYSIEDGRVVVYFSDDTVDSFEQNGIQSSAFAEVLAKGRLKRWVLSQSPPAQQ